mmetsp:Transcript_25687/g.67200  ORF Transcript_25687/g.67200 Transcript_25687/m.67200 type:complete len:264 (-) Transcript_25687:375-1166(-)
MRALVKLTAATATETPLPAFSMPRKGFPASNQVRMVSKGARPSSSWAWNFIWQRMRSDGSSHVPAKFNRRVALPTSREVPRSSNCQLLCALHVVNDVHGLASAVTPRLPFHDLSANHLQLRPSLRAQLQRTPNVNDLEDFSRMIPVTKNGPAARYPKYRARHVTFTYFQGVSHPNRDVIDWLVGALPSGLPLPIVRRNEFQWWLRRVKNHHQHPVSADYGDDVLNPPPLPNEVVTHTIHRHHCQGVGGRGAHCNLWLRSWTLR